MQERAFVQKSAQENSIQLPDSIQLPEKQLLKERNETLSYEVLIDLTSFFKYSPLALFKQLRSMYPEGKFTAFINNTKPEYNGSKKLKIYEQCFNFKVKLLSTGKPISLILKVAEQLKRNLTKNSDKRKKVVLVSNSHFLISKFVTLFEPQELNLIMTKRDYKDPVIQEILKETFKNKKYRVIKLDLLPAKLACLKTLLSLSNREAKEAKGLTLKSTLTQKLLDMLPAPIEELKAELEKYERYENRSLVALASFIWHNNLHVDPETKKVFKKQAS